MPFYILGLYYLFFILPFVFLSLSHISYAIVVMLLSDIMVRQAAMAFKCLLLIYYKNGRGHNFRRQVIWLLRTKNFL